MRTPYDGSARPIAMHPWGRLHSAVKNALCAIDGRDGAGLNSRFVREMAQILSQSRTNLHNGFVRSLQCF